jgi:hypothetical protein
MRKNIILNRIRLDDSPQLAAGLPPHLPLDGGGGERVTNIPLTLTPKRGVAPSGLYALSPATQPAGKHKGRGDAGDTPRQTAGSIHSASVRKCRADAKMSLFRGFIISIIIGFAVLFAAIANTQPTGRLLVDGLETAKVGKFPSSWRTWPLQRGKTSEIYHVEQEGKLKFIRARDDKDYSLQAMRDFNWPIDQYPYLSWRWRAHELPTGAREDNDDLNDSACGVYVIFGKTSGHALKYVWSTQLPLGKVVTRREGKLKIKVAESGSGHVNQWRRASVKVPSDYKELFGSELSRNPTGIAILTDGNATHTAAACDYAEFTISRETIK